MKKIGLVFFICISINNILIAQPANYWSVSFNSEASLLAGAVVGGNSDITSIFYNPAGIAEIEDRKFALNANLFNLSYTKYKNALGTGLNLDYLGFTVQPRFISYIIKLKKVEEIVFQFAIFNRDDKYISVYDQLEKPVRLIHPAYQENYTGNIDFISDYIDSWGGIGLAYEINDKISIGGSFLGSVKNFAYMKLINVDIQPFTTSIPDTIAPYNATSDSFEKLIMYDVRIIGKFGIRYHLNRINFGLNISLPSLKLFGNADNKRNIANTGIYSEGNPVENVYLNESTKYLKSQFKDPLSISFGAVFTNSSGKSSYYLSAEYFHKIDTYKAINGTEVVDDNYEPASDFLSYKYGSKSIINVAIGMQNHLTDKFELLFGLKTNFSPYEVSDEDGFEYINEFSTVPVDLYHITAGSKFNFKNLSVIAGFEFVTGITEGMTEFVNFAEPEVRPGTVLALSGEKNNNMAYAYNSLGFYFGFTVGF